MKKKVTHYEVHLLRNDRWWIDCAGLNERDCRTAASERVRRVDVPGVRVIKEIYDPEADIAAARVLFEHVRPIPTKLPQFLAPRGRDQRPPECSAEPQIVRQRPTRRRPPEVQTSITPADLWSCSFGKVKGTLARFFGLRP